MIYEVIHGDKYKHYKGSIYTVTGMATHTENNEGLVIYKDDKDCIWARPMEMFFGYLDDGRKRFTLVDKIVESEYLDEELFYFDCPKCDERFDHHKWNEATRNIYGQKIQEIQEQEYAGSFICPNCDQESRIEDILDDREEIFL